MVASSALTALYPGSFDPFHNGHLDVVEQSVELFGSVVIAVMHNPQKPSGLIDLDRRVELVRAHPHVDGRRGSQGAGSRQDLHRFGDQGWGQAVRCG